jgi:hypothetical protein
MHRYENKTKNTYENIWIYFTVIVVKFLYVSVTFWGHLQGGVLSKDVLQRQQNQYTIIKY